ncbi:defect-in-organelle-trafficking protein DotD [Oxalobacteraceae bacterium GrIS 1.11]
MKKCSTLVRLCLCCALGGCAAPRVEKSNHVQGEVDRQILEASRKIERMQLQLVQAGALNQTAKTIPASMVSKGQTMSISWKGDAFQLLAKLAAERGLAFVSIGVRLPLPVAINVQDATFEAVLEAIRAQTTYRAVVAKTADKLTLTFNRPQSWEGKS